MGRNPIKENQNPYFRARKQAAEWDARLESRERASELIGIAAYTLADYELGNVKRVPADKVLIMADLYNAPWLLSNYCKNECPICGFLPLATEEKNICSVTVRLLKALREDELENMKNQLLEISQDGKIRDDEVEAVRKISEYLDGMVIERTILSKVAELNGISICDERTVKIELTEAEIEEAYRIREREYLEEDIKNAVEEFCDYWGIPKGIAGGLNDNPDIICKIASLYEKNQDTNVASADTMKEAVKQVLKKEGVWK